MAKTVNASGTGTLPVSGPDEISSVTISDVNFDATDKGIVTPTNSVEDADGAFVPYVASIGNGSMIVKTREQLPTAMTFNYISVT